MFTFQAIQILIFLIPGFIADSVYNGLVVRRQPKEFKLIIEALIFSVLIYTPFYYIFEAQPILFTKKDDLIIYSFNGTSLSILLLFSLLVPIVFSYIVNNDIHLKILRFFKITPKTSGETVWLDVFYKYKNPIIINFEDGRRIYGWPMYYSETPQNPYIFLYKPKWIDDKNEFIELNNEGILITPEMKIQSIEFLKKEKIALNKEEL
jgi:hypothetical protein